MTLVARARAVYVLRMTYHGRLTMRSPWIPAALVAVFALVLAGTIVLRAMSPDVPSAVGTKPATERPVSGTGVHFVTTAIIHSTEQTAAGLIQRSTETVDLTGDLTGRILYQPTTVVDFSTGTLTNTGRQVFSGTVLGSAPVLLYDDEFRFEADLNTGAATGKVYLSDNLAGPKIRCELEIIATGRTAEGNLTADYTGYCKFKNK
jgi:hypothetical protein